jgi:hypothetical protein
MGTIIGWGVLLLIVFGPIGIFFWAIGRAQAPAAALSEAQQRLHVHAARKCLAVSGGLCLVMLLAFSIDFMSSKELSLALYGKIVLPIGVICLIVILVSAKKGVRHATLGAPSGHPGGMHKAIAVLGYLGFLSILTSGAIKVLGGLAWGRPLRVDGKIVKPALRDGDSWAQGERADSASLNRPTRLALEALWLHDAKKEYASVPAFSRLCWQLAALAAPPELLRDVCIAALQEIEHARKCFALAAGFGGQAQTIMPMPDMLAESFHIDGNPFVQLAVESLSDGCMLEGFNADTAHHSASMCRDPASLALIKQIAREEMAHAELSWRVLEFCCRQDPEPVANALRAEMEKLARAVRPTATSSEHMPLVQAADQDALLRYGRLPDAAFDQLWRARMQDTKQRLASLLDDIGIDESLPSQSWQAISTNRGAQGQWRSQVIGRH